MIDTFDSIVTQMKLGGAVTNKLTVHLIQSVSVDRLYAEGFRNWDGNMVLLPQWALEYMADGSKLVCIDGKVATVGVDYIDNDTRGGCIAYGVPHSHIPRTENT